jgi:dipeptidyl aminopeptidase/acylaminoacyl peptidase
MRPSRTAMARSGLLLLLALAPVLVLGADTTPPAADSSSTSSVYRTPPQILADLIDAPPTPSVRLDPRREWMLLLEQPSLPPIAELAERELHLGGLRIRPRSHGPSRSGYATGLRLLRLSDLAERQVTGLPAAARIENVRFSPDGARFAFTHTAADGIELWVAEVASGQARRLSATHLNLAIGGSPQWLRDGSLVATLVVPDQGPEPPAPTVPAGPILQESRGRTAPARTYQDLLKNAYDEALFEYYLTAQVARITPDGQVVLLGRPGLVAGVSPSPDGRYLLVQRLHRPFSYVVPAYRFPRRAEVWDLDGKVLRTIADLPLQEEIPIAFDSVATGPRSLDWRNDAPATLYWAEALDGGDPGREAAQRDKVLTLAAPFTGEPATLATLAWRYGGIVWGNDDLALMEESWWKTRRTRTWILRLGDGDKAPELLFDRSSEDRYADPGFPLMVPNAWGRQVLQTADGGKTLFLSGDGASAEGDRPFLDALDVGTNGTKKTKRLFRSEAPYYEEPVALLGTDGRYALVRREAVEEPANYFVRDLKTRQLRQITRFPHPTPQLLGIHKELLRYARPDGVQLTATLYTPAGWKSGDAPLPMVMWAYPQEFKSASAAGQVSDSPYRFVRAGWWSPVLWLTQGYAVLDNPSLPIVGEGDKEPNDSYVDQLVASAKAAVDEVVRRGVADPRRIAIGGHSYGAFTTANLLAHSDLFAAGVAESGAYNRTLTPFGFQSEERDLWHASETYIKMSPFLYADKIRKPLLLVHGQADNNPGTDPIQTDRFYSALKGNGATVRLVVLPFESHGYRARESILHLLWESSNWLDTYVKNRPADTNDAAGKPAAKP